ncbi:thiamine diphosphokinase [Algirhabdus cladophorae]|uniref:thiamine diphosphokinase n=1 Tax=Algirhabdus cladophorae TaxID=3377108 RepID=UPI003B847E8B
MAQLWTVSISGNSAAMQTEIVHKLDPIALVGAGQLTQSTFKVALTLTNGTIAADGGAASALGFGITPDLTIGDMDSLDQAERSKLDPDAVIHLTEQNSTDFEKVLQRVTAPLFVAVGFLGNRIDHSLACFNALVRYAHRPVILLGETDLAFVVPPVITFEPPVHSRLSLFPMDSVSGRSKGLEWPIDGLEFAPGAMIGTSNRSVGPVQLQMDAPAMLAIMPACQIRSVITPFTAAPRWSDARAG